ncbi:MAG: hypothetical protein EOM18_14960, partial [Clostridia bacterium]|nr:hypothetical protein [Clostridia bacterium]
MIDRTKPVITAESITYTDITYQNAKVSLDFSDAIPTYDMTLLVYAYPAGTEDPEFGTTSHEAFCKKTITEGTTFAAVELGDFTPGTAYDVYFVVKDAYNNESDPVMKTLTTAKEPLDNNRTFNIQGNPAFGEVLSINDEFVEPTDGGTITYTWSRTKDGETEEIGNGKTYRVVKEDIGATITLRVSAKEGYSDAVKTTETVTKAAGPQAPTLAEQDDEADTFTFESMSGTIYSYKINGDEWKDITAAGTTTVISVGNTAIEKGKLAVCIKKTETHFQGDELTNETPFTAYLEGKVTINKMTGVTSGDTLTAQVTGQQSGAKLHYEWTANGTKVGTDKSSYTVSDNDAGKIIAVKVTADGYVKSLASGKTSAVVKKQSSVTWKPGWQQVNNQWYYGNSNGKIATGWVNVGSKWYLMSESGAMLTGWQTVNGTRYYLSSSTSDGSMKTGWQNIGGQW